MRSIEEIRTLKEDLYGYFRVCRNNYKKCTDAFNQQIHIGKMTKGIEVYKDPKARQHINSMTNHIMILGQDVILPLWNESEKTKELASKLKRFGKATLQLLDQRYKSVRRNAITNSLLYGVGIVKQLYLPRLRGDRDDDEWSLYLKSTFPFHYRACHPATMAWIDDDCAIEIYERKVFDVKKTWGDWKTNKNNFDDVEWWEYWTRDHRVFFADNEVVIDEVNPYGFIPYEVFHGGFGVESATGKPEDLIVSVIAPLLSSYKMSYRAKTSILKLLEYAAMTRPVMNRLPYDWEKLETDAAEMSYIAEDANLRHFGPDVISPDMYRIINMLDNDQESVVPGIMAGAGSKYETGYGQASRMDYARISLLASCIANWEYAAGNILNKTLQLIENHLQDDDIEEPVGILGNFGNEYGMVTIKPSEINTKLQHFFVKLDAITPEQKEHRWRLGMDSWVVKSLSLETLHTDFYGIDHITEKERMLVERAMNHPAVIEVLTREALTDVGMRDLVGMIQEGKFNEPRAPLQGIGGRSNENMREMGAVGTQQKAEEFR